jgi:hypothetical protein
MHHAPAPIAMKSSEAWHVVRLHGRRIIGIGKMPLLK